MSVEYKPGLGINFSDIYKQEYRERTSPPETISGQDVAQLVEQGFDQVSSPVNYHLVDANVVLTLAGMKPRTDFWVPVPTDDDSTQVSRDVETLNNFLQVKHPEARFQITGKPHLVATQSGDVLGQSIMVHSLLGWERWSKMTKFPGITPFDRKQGWDGLKEWYWTMIDALEKAQEEGKLPKSDHVLGGVLHGYPDAAILDVVNTPQDQMDHLQDSEIPHALTYDNADPSFDFKPEHANDPDIQTYIKKAGGILKDFYQSKWHKSKKAALAFHRSK